ncbi:MAG: DNA replication/repair protein RecF [Bdellovibrionia bacterium]
MKVQYLSLKNFRNIEETHFKPDPNLNLLVGLNGQGKTSIIEALGLLATLRSFRDSKNANLIRWGTSAGQVECTVVSDDTSQGEWKTDLRISFQVTDRIAHKASKIAYINQKPYSSSTAYLSQRFRSYEQGFHTVTFNPSDHDLIRGNPSTRRAYLDQVLAAENSRYLVALQKYQRVLSQRNALLKSSPNATAEALFGFTEQLCKHGSFITHERLKWLQRVETTLNSMASKITNHSEGLRMIYLSNWVPNCENLSLNNNSLGAIHFTGQAQLPSLELLEQSFWVRVSAFEAVERRTGYSVVGPHRDDWTFFMNGQVLKGHGSQGEVRSALLALKLSEIALFRKETGHRPLFLLDDFSSELDEKRRSFLLDFLLETDLQTFITTTEDSFSKGKRFWLCNGTVKEGIA